MAIVKEFSASRWTRGNLLFPDILRLQDDCVVHLKRGLFKSDQESMIYSKVASVEVVAGWVFATLSIESAGGTNSIFVRGLRKGDAIEANETILRLQTAFEKAD